MIVRYQNYSQISLSSDDNGSLVLQTKPTICQTTVFVRR